MSKGLKLKSPNFVWDLTWPREGLWMVKISKISLQLNSIFIKFWKSTIFFIKFAKLFLLLFHNVYNEKMFTIEKEDGLQVPLKPSIFILFLSICLNPNAKMAKRIRPKFLWDLKWQQERFKEFALKNYDYSKSTKNWLTCGILFLLFDYLRIENGADKIYNHRWARPALGA